MYKWNRNMRAGWVSEDNVWFLKSVCNEEEKKEKETAKSDHET